MPVVRPAYINNGFFSSLAPITTDKQDKGSAFVDVGGCCLRAAAARLIDVFLQDPRAHAELFNKVMASHFRSFPTHRPTLPGLVTPSERIQQLVKDVPMRELVHYLAETLEQFVNIEMNVHHLRYRDAFIGRHEALTLTEMRKLDQKILVRALAKALSIGIEVRVVERVKQLPKRLLYGAENFVVVMKEQDGYYTPRINLSDRFSSIGSRPVRTLQSATSPLVQEHSPSDIQAALSVEDERLLTVFEATYNRLNGMVLAEEVNKDDLLAIYTNGMVGSDNVPEDVVCAGLEHGSQRFFDEIIGAQRGTPKYMLAASDDAQHLEHELVHALSREIAVGQRSTDDVFAQIEYRQESASR